MVPAVGHLRAKCRHKWRLRHLRAKCLATLGCATKCTCGCNLHAPAGAHLTRWVLGLTVCSKEKAGHPNGVSCFLVPAVGLEPT